MRVGGTEGDGAARGAGGRVLDEVTAHAEQGAEAQTCQQAGWWADRVGTMLNESSNQKMKERQVELYNKPGNGFGGSESTDAHECHHGTHA